MDEYEIDEKSINEKSNKSFSLSSRLGFVTEEVIQASLEEGNEEETQSEG